MEVEDLYLTPQFLYVADGDNGSREDKKGSKFGEARAGVWNSKGQLLAGSARREAGAMLSSEAIVRFLHAWIAGRPEQKRAPDEPGYERRSRVEIWITRGDHATQP